MSLPKLWSLAYHLRIVAIIILFAGAMTYPMINAPIPWENNAERQAQTAGMIRLYCQNPKATPLQSPQLPFGRLTFNIEFSIVEWAEGRIAAAIDGPKCMSVEPLARAISITAGLAAILAVCLIASFIVTPHAGIIAAIVLAHNGDWLKFSTYTLVDVRMVTLGLFAIYAMLKRRLFTSTLLWFLCITHKPQSLFFIGPFYIALDFLRLSKAKDFFRVGHLVTYLSPAAALAAATAYLLYSAPMNAAHDLPWLTWTGPALTKWIFGPWHERTEFIFYKTLILDTLKRTGLVVAVPLLVCANILAQKNENPAAKQNLKTTLFYICILALPYFVGRGLFTFTFLNVFKVHDYYSLPLIAFGALTKGLVFGKTLSVLATYATAPAAASSTTSSAASSAARITRTHFTTAILAVVIALQAISSFKTYPAHVTRIEATIKTPSDWHVFHSWSWPTFPEERTVVVVADPTQGRSYMYLYLARQSGFGWCAQRPEIAPRAFWKEQGVKYVAWPLTLNEHGIVNQWTIRTIDEELAYARAQGWSSDTNDYWAGRTMGQWAATASTHALDPCLAQTPDPRQWPH